MAHVHESGKVLAKTAAKAAEQAASPMMMGGGMAHGMEGMEGMMGMGGMGNMMGGQAMASGLATGAAMTVSTKTGHSFMKRLAKNPWVWFGAGLAVGYLVHKYRTEIIDSATRAAEKGKDFVLQQRENLEDIVASGKEAADDSGKS